MLCFFVSLCLKLYQLKRYLRLASQVSAFGIAGICIRHRRYLHSASQVSAFGSSGHKPDDLAATLCPYYIYTGSEFRLAGAEERRGTMAEDAVGGIEENIFIG